MSVSSRIKRAWNVFKNEEANRSGNVYIGGGAFGGRSPNKLWYSFSSERSIIAAIYNRIAIDAAGIPIRHVQLDDQHRYSSEVDSGLNRCLTFKPNIDQKPRSFRQDIVLTLFDKGVAAIVAVDKEIEPIGGKSFDVKTLRVGEVTGWYAEHVRVNLYNQTTGNREEVLIHKDEVAIVENPLYSVMNEPNSTLQRLIRKLNYLDVVDEQSNSGKLDIIIQLPYTLKTETKKAEAAKRREDIETQLKGSQYGIAYLDGTEKVTQLNRPAENNLLKQVEYLTNLLYSQLGITETVMNGTADEATMINYINRTIEPILDAIVEALEVTFLGDAGIIKNEIIGYYRDPFKLAAISTIAEIADKFTRNEILSSNEIRGAIGIAPSTDPKADQLLNSNMPQPHNIATSSGPSTEEMDKIFNDTFDSISKDIDKMLGE